MTTDENPAVTDCQSRTSVKDQTETDNKGSPSLNRSSGLQPGCETTLPPELWMHILTFFHKYELETVSRVNSWFQEATLPMLWECIDDLEYAPDQERIIAQIQQNPRKGNAVQELSMLWHWKTEYDNDQLVREIAKRCPNVTMLDLAHGGRGQEIGPGEEVFHVKMTSKHVDTLATIFQSFPRLKEFSMEIDYTQTIDACVRKELAERCLPTIKALQTLKLLSDHLMGIGNMFLQHNDGHLRKLVLPKNSSSERLSPLAVSQPYLTWLESDILHLKELRILMSISPNLAVFVVKGVSPHRETIESAEQESFNSWLPLCVEAWPALKVLCIGYNYRVTDFDLHVLASNEFPSLSRLSIGRVTYWAERVLSAERLQHYDGLFAAIVTRHSSTLEALHIGRNDAAFGPQTIRACTKAKKLKILEGCLPKHPPAEMAHLLDELADKCPLLRAVSSAIVDCANNDSNLRSPHIDSGMRFNYYFMELFRESWP